MPSGGSTRGTGGLSSGVPPGGYGMVIPPGPPGLSSGVTPRGTGVTPGYPGCMVILRGTPPGYGMVILRGLPGYPRGTPGG